MQKSKSYDAAETVFANFSSPIIAFDRDGRVLAFNPAAAKILGLSKSKRTGKSLSSIYLSGSEKLFKAVKDIDRSRKIRVKAGIRGSGAIYDARVQLVLGSWKGKEAVFAINRLNAADAESEESPNIEREVELLFYEAMDLMCIVGYDGSVKKLSPSWEAKLGRPIRDIMNDGLIRAYIHPDDKKKTEQAFKNVIKHGEITNFRNRYVAKDGSIIALDWCAKAIAEHEMIIATARDVTREVMMEEKTRMLEQAVQIEYMKTQFFSNISHEFRTPISIILATANLIKSSLERELIEVSNKEMMTKHMLSIEKNCFRLLRLVNNIIDITKIDAGCFDICMQSCDIIKLVEDVVMSAEEFIKSRGLKLTFESNAKQKIVACDVQAIERIILNLLSNAVKFTPEGGKISVKILDLGAKVQISVSDTGIGISKEHQEAIFERFRQADDLMTRSHEGSGIGLSLVKSLVELHSGTVKVVSEKGHGAEFIIELPAAGGKTLSRRHDRILDNMDAFGAKIEFSDIS